MFICIKIRVLENKGKQSTYFDGAVLVSKLAWITIVFALFCFATTLFVSSKTLKEEAVFEKTGGEIGPFDITRENTIFKVKVHQTLFPNSWSSVNVSVLNENRVELFTVAKDLWSERGYDGGYWSESDLDFTADFTLFDKGKYYIVFEPELSNDHSLIGEMSVFVWEKRNSSIPFVFAGFLSLIIGILLLVFKNNIISFF